MGEGFAGPNSGPALPSDMRLDPNVEQNMAVRGIWYVIRDDGLRTAWNGEPMKCPVCQGCREAMPTCEECVGRGVVDHVPFAPRPWDQVAVNLWLGGHDTQPNLDDRRKGLWRGECFITPEDGFGLVVSLHQRFDNLPPPGVEHHTYRMADADLDPEHHTALDQLADVVAQAVKDGRKTLVRCHAGLNRSALVAGLAMMKLGWSAHDAITQMRQARSPYVLCNESFVAYLEEKEKDL